MPHLENAIIITLLTIVALAIIPHHLRTVEASSGCAFHTIDGASAESEAVRFIRLREDAELGTEVLKLRAYPRSMIALKGVDGSGDHKYFSLTELNSTTVRINLVRSLEDLVDRDVPRNLLKFRIVCSGKNEKIEEGSYMSITVYIEDVNDNVPEFLNVPYIVDVDENTPPGTIIFEGIQAFDRDKPNTPNSEVHFSMSTVPEQLSADGSPYFALKSPHRPLLVLKKDLDFDDGLRLFKLPLFAWDRGTPANQVNTTITINVRDVDDLPPKFTEGVYRTKINEFYPVTGIPIRIPLYFSPPIMAFDQDSLNATLIYDIISGNERQLFRVNPNNAIIYLQKEIDLEEESLPGNTFVLQIEARQKDNPLKKALARIEVEIMDLNDNVPEFEADFYNISIVENLPTGFSVLQVNAIDRDQGENAEFIYNLIEQQDAAGAFRIDSRSGWITVRDDGLLDREKRKSIRLAVEALERNPPYRNDASMPTMTDPSSVKVEITLLDTNDNTPKFDRGSLYEFKVPVTAPVGYEIGQVVALDPDEGPNGMLLYELQRPKGSGYIPFGLNNKNGTIYVNGPLRRGRIAVFVEASDQPTNPSERRFSLAVITIEVYASLEEQAIDFVGAPYEFWVGSNVPLGMSVGQVRTTLMNDGEDEIMYDLLHTYSEGVPFAIEERSGIITVIRELSEFTRKIYHFEAVANYLFANSTQSLIMSRSSQPLTSTPATELSDEGVLITNVTIHVIAKTDNRVPLRPVIEEINMNVIQFHIEENLVGGIIGQLLYKNGINVVSNDLESFRQLQGNSNVTMGSRFRSRNRQLQARSRLPRRLVGDSSIKLRYIIANQQDVTNRITITEDGTLLTLTGLDREQKDKYDLTVIVEYTTGQMSGAGIYQVHINVDDVNDNAPKFNCPTYIGLITENSPAGQEVAINRAILIADADLGRNAEFSVTVKGDYSDQFAIEYFNASEANDGRNGQSPMAAETFHFFNLTDQWNDDMRFMELQSSLKQSSQSSNSGPYFRVSYTGKRPLDREKDQIFSLKIVAVDSGGLSSYANLNILVADVNDNAPIFERISVFKDSKVEIREYTTDMEIYFVENSVSHTQNQPSMSMGGMLPSPSSSYHIPGSPRQHSVESFSPSNGSTNSSSGGFRSRSRPRSKSRMRVSRASSAQRLPPKCPLFALYEDTPVTTKVLQVIAGDEDFGKNAQIHYEIADEHVDRPFGAPIPPRAYGARQFAIDKLTGELSVNYPLLANMEVFLNLTATDIDGLRDTTCLRFTVIDVNNHAPTFKKSWYSFDIEEGDYNDSVLGQVLAVDLDFGENANISYNLSDSDLPFRIKPMSGIIKIVSALDREVRGKYNFQVIARDNAESPFRLSSSVDVEVNVLDVNDNRPEFVGYDDMAKAELFVASTVVGAEKPLELPVYKAYLDRNTQPGMFVKQVTAIDKDYIGNGNGLVLYSIQHQHQHQNQHQNQNQNLHVPIFQIDSRDGSIRAVTSFGSFNDYEHLNVTVVASDLGSPPLTSMAVVLVNLQGQAVTEPPSANHNQLSQPANAPLFQHQYYEVQVMENNEPPNELLRINVSMHVNASAYRWSLMSDEDAISADDIVADASQPPFIYDPNTSVLYAVKSLDREKYRQYNLRLRGDKPNREARTYTRVAYPVMDERIEGLDYNECRIVVQVLDENDNSPKFKRSGQPIIAVVPRSASFGYPITRVEASDPDEGLNAEIRYRLLNEPSRLFGIDDLTGKIRLVGSVPADERVYGFDVKATDRSGADDGRSSIANVFVYIIDEARQVRIVVAGKPVEVERRIDALMRGLSEAIQMDVRIRLLEPHVGSLEPATDAYIYAVDYRSNSVLEMEQLQESLASLQLDTLQLALEPEQDDQENGGQRPSDSSQMPRIIELAEFGQLSHNSQRAGSSIGGLEVVTVALMALCGVGVAMTALCFLCMRQKRGSIWSQQDFPSSETGLTYTVARAGIDACRRHRSRQSLTQQQQQPQQQQCGKSIKTTSSFVPESVSSSAQTQSTAMATQQLEQHLLQHHHNYQQHQLHHFHHQHFNNNEPRQQREYIDVPLPKSIAKGSPSLPSASQRCTPMDSEVTTSPSPFVLKFNACQPVNNLSSTNPHDASMFSLHSNGQDSGVDFLSSRELYENTPDSFGPSQTAQLPYVHPTNLCPRHAKEQLQVTQNNNCRSSAGGGGGGGGGGGALATRQTDSSDNYEDSLQNDEPLVSINCRSGASDYHHHHHHHRHDYSSGKFEKRSCVRHSFSGVKDDLVQNSPQISLRPRGHILRNSMNDLEERLHNLELSFRRPLDFGKPNNANF